jgi:hypothetical protein
MNLEPLPPHLRELEEQLARRPCPEPPAELRARLLSAVREDWPPSVAERFRRPWAIAWRAAAAILLVLNLGLSAANGVRFARLTPPPEVRAVVDTDDRWSALAASALASLSPAPDTGTMSQDFFSRKGENRWAMP